METRTLRYGGSAVTVEYEAGRPAEIVEFLFGSLAPAHGETRPPLTGYRVLAGKEPGTLALQMNRNTVYEGTDEGRLAELLMSGVCHDLADRSRGGLLIHAGAMAWRGKAVLLAGAVGAGKTTMALWLANRGLVYLTDEMVFAGYGSLTLKPFVRPLNLKSPSRKPLKDAFDFEAHAGDLMATPAGDLIPPAVLGTTGERDDLPPALFLFPRYVPGGDASLERLTGAQAGLELMQCLVNARNLPDHGFKAAVRLGASAPACRLSYGSFDQIAHRIDELLHSI
jgi:hypothetical protein